MRRSPCGNRFSGGVPSEIEANAPGRVQREQGLDQAEGIRLRPRWLGEMARLASIPMTGTRLFSRPFSTQRAPEEQHQADDHQQCRPQAADFPRWCWGRRDEG